MSGLELIIAFAGYVALLLWGVRMVRTGITRSFTGELRKVVALGADNRLAAAGVGLVVAAGLQSSTAAGFIISSLVARGIMTLAMALAMMLGADIGSALAAFLFSFDISWLSPLLLAAGVYGFMASRLDRNRSLARIAIGLGLALLSLRLMGTASAGLKESAGLASFLGLLADQPLIALAMAAGLTWLVHSSLSVVVLVMSLTAAHIVPLPLGLALVLGANVGGCLAPFVDQLGAPAATRRVPLGNLVMRSATALVLLPFLPAVAGWIGGLHLAAPGYAMLVFHIAYNAATALVWLPFVGRLAPVLQRLLPDEPAEGDAGRPRYLDANLLESPTEALACATRETLALADLVAGMLEQSLEVLEKDDSRLLQQIRSTDDSVDDLHEAIKLYLMKVSHTGMAPEDSRRFVEILTFVTNLEHIGDIIDTNLMDLAAKKIRKKLLFSREGRDELRQFHGRVRDNMRLAFNVFTLRDARLARKLIAEKPLLREAEIFSANSHFARLRAGRPESLETSSIHLDIIRDLKRINSHLTSVAYPILEATGELLATRLRRPSEDIENQPEVSGRA